MPSKILEPWLSFLVDVDKSIGQPMVIHCLGGFVLTTCWALPRPTGDVDFIDIAPLSAADELLSVAGEGSKLSMRYNLHFHRVVISEYPEEYASRLADITPDRLQHLKLKALEVHDLVLAKLSRNSPRDRSDVAYLVRRGVLSRKILEERFHLELRPYLLNEDRETLTLKLWIEEFFEDR